MTVYRFEDHPEQEPDPSSPAPDGRIVTVTVEEGSQAGKPIRIEDFNAGVEPPGRHKTRREKLAMVGRFLGEDNELYLQLQSLTVQLETEEAAWEEQHERCLTLRKPSAAERRQGAKKKA